MEMANVVIQFIMLSAAVLMLLFVTAFGQAKVYDHLVSFHLLSTVVFLPCGCVFVASLVVVALRDSTPAIDRAQLGEEIKHISLIKMMADYVDADWLKGLLLVTTLPFMLLLLLVSAANQAVRRCAHIPSPPPHGGDAPGSTVVRSRCTSLRWDMLAGHAHLTRTPRRRRRLCCPHIRSAIMPCTLAVEQDDGVDAMWWLTPKARAVSRWILKRPSPTLCWTMWMGVLYFCLDVGVGKITVIALSWLNERCATLSPGMVTVIVCAFGIFLFLLPPIPGVPVYLFSGVVLVASLDDSMGFWPAVFVTSILCLCIKLTACTIQQKVFGENLSDRVAVRRLVGMNSMTLRAIRYNLSQKGLTPAKVAILCGGPDWPTSVLCGILRLPLYECLLGTLPVYPIYLVSCLPHAYSHGRACPVTRWLSGREPAHDVSLRRTVSLRLVSK